MRASMSWVCRQRPISRAGSRPRTGTATATAMPRGQTMWRAKTLEASLIALGLAFAPAAANAGWQDEASAYDAGRLGKLSESKEKGLSEAEHGGSQSDIALIHAVLDAPSQNASAEALEGRWRCRTIKLGGMTPDVIYSWFSCRISDRG